MHTRVSVMSLTVGGSLLVLSYVQAEVHREQGPPAP